LLLEEAIARNAPFDKDEFDTTESETHTDLSFDPREKAEGPRTLQLDWRIQKQVQVLQSQVVLS
jgi:hypothetical protein